MRVERVDRNLNKSDSVKVDLVDERMIRLQRCKIVIIVQRDNSGER